MSLFSPPHLTNRFLRTFMDPPGAQGTQTRDAKNFFANELEAVSYSAYPVIAVREQLALYL
jgi:hypothetical protein